MKFHLGSENCTRLAVSLTPKNCTCSHVGASIENLYFSSSEDFSEILYTPLYGALVDKLGLYSLRLVSLSRIVLLLALASSAAASSANTSSVYHPVSRHGVPAARTQICSLWSVRHPSNGIQLRDRVMLC